MKKKQLSYSILSPSSVVSTLTTFALLVTTPLAFSASPISKVSEVQGVAINEKNKIFYIENNKLETKDGKLTTIETKYISEDSTVLAEMKADLSKNSYLPDLTMKDFRDGYEYAIKYLPEDKKVKISQKNGAKSEWDSKLINFKENMTNSVGLMNYIRDHALDLKKEKQKVFRYIIPSRQDDYGMVVKFKSQDKNLLKFNFEIENFLIRSLAGSGENLIVFDTDTSRITQFEGIAVLLDDNDKGVKVNLSYSTIKEEK